MKTHTHKLAIAVLALSLTHTANAADNSTHNDSDNKSTYWGLGIGSVLGAAIAGPPGAAIGATLGGSIGWGKDQNDALDEEEGEWRLFCKQFTNDPPPLYDYGAEEDDTEITAWVNTIIDAFCYQFDVVSKYKIFKSK